MGNMFGSKANQAPLNADLGELAYLDTKYLEATYLKQSGATLAGNLVFSGNSRRVLGDFSNATLGNRLYLQASTDNAATAVGAIPSGTGNSAAFNVFNSSDPANAGYLQFLINATEARLYSGFTGTGTTLPMTFYAGGSERMRISAAGNVGIGKSAPDQLLQLIGGNIDLQEQTAGRRIGFYVGDSYTAGTVGGTVATARYGLTFGSYIGSSLNLGGWGGLTFSTSDAERLRIDSNGNLLGQDNLLTRAMLKDTGYAYYNSGTTNALDYVNGSHQRWTPATGAQTLSIANWPPTGNLGELLIEGVNLGAATITWPTINWIKSDGTTTTTFSSNGVTLQTSGTDWVLLWTRDAGTTIYGKVVR